MGKAGRARESMERVRRANRLPPGRRVKLSPDNFQMLALLFGSLEDKKRLSDQALAQQCAPINASIARLFKILKLKTVGNVHFDSDGRQLIEVDDDALKAREAAAEEP